MRVGIVGHELEDERTGVGRVLSGLLAGAVGEAPPSWRFVVFSRRRLDHPVLDAEQVEAEAPDRPPRFAHPVLWEQLELPARIRARNLDVVFSPSYSLPGRIATPGVVTVHDLSFERLPEEFGWRQLWRRRLLARRACRVAARVLVDARRIAGELAERYRLPRERIGVVAPAIDEAFRPVADAEERERDAVILAGLGVERPFLLHVGSLLERRNPAGLLASLEQARARDPAFRLVLAGPQRLRRPQAFREAVRRSPSGSRVVELGWIDDRALLALYRNASLTLSLSSYEGFCLPPLESLACGTPAVAGSAPGLDDLWPGYPWRVSTEAPDPQGAAVGRVLDAVAGGEWRADEAIARVRARDWREAARRWLEELERARAAELSERIPGPARTRRRRAESGP